MSKQQTVWDEPIFTYKTDDSTPSKAAGETSFPEKAESSDCFVWDEPQMAGIPPKGENYASRLKEKMAALPVWKSWCLVGGMLALTGPFAILCAFFGASVTMPSITTQLFAAVILAPITEELGKVGIFLIAAETRPWLFRRSSMILFGAVLSGLIFAVLENLIYFNFYLENPDTWLIRWRWTACIALHVTASTLAGLGVMRMHRNAVKLGHPPQYKDASGWLYSAMILHGIYNLGAFGAGLYMR